MSDEIVGPSGNREEGKRRTADAKLDLALAYHSLFRGRASDAQRDAVLVDLASFSNFYFVAPGGLGVEYLAYREGQRSVYGRIASFLNMTYEERSKLEQATRHEGLVDNIEGML